MRQFLIYLIIIIILCVLPSLDSKKTTTKNPRGTTTPSDSGNDDDNYNCVDEWKRKNPRLQKRFADTFMNEHCKKGKIWKKNATEAIKHPPKPILTKDQLKWVNGVYGCRDIICLCRLWSFCNKFLIGIERTLGNLTESFNDLNKGVKNVNDILKGKPQPNTGGFNPRMKRQTIQQINDVIQDKVGKAVRKDLRMMTTEERMTFFRALNKLKLDKIDNLSKYDILVVYHTPEYAPEAHFCGAFFPFHRELLKNIEVAIRTVEPTAALPLWDPTLDEGLPDPKDSIMWTADFMGNGDGEVVTGPFANWTVYPDAQIPPLTNSLRIVRGVGQSPFGSLLKQSDIEEILSKPAFRDLVYCVDPFVELIHGATHMWIGGHMLELRISPNDPAFFLYHCFIDSIWELWRQQKQTDKKLREKEFVNDTEACNTYCTATADMKPFPLKVIGGLSNQYIDQLYFYEPRAACSAQNTNCGSSNVFCNTKTYRCISKVKAGGNCTGLESFDSCLNSVCTSGKCQTVATAPVIITLPPTTTTTTIATTTTKPPVVTTKIGAHVQINMSVPTTVSNTVRTTTTEIFAPKTEANTVAPVVKTVWIPITVLSMVGTTAQPYPDAKIISTDIGHGIKLNGDVADPAQVPYYTGAAYAQVLNPFGVTDSVEATLEVLDSDYNKCTSMCFNSSGTYTPCDPKISLSSSAQSNTDVLFTPTFDLAKLLGWDGNKRNSDKFLFICKSQTVVTTTSAPDAKQTTAVPTTPAVTVQTVIKVNNNSNSGTGNVIINTKSDNVTSQIANGGCHNEHRCCAIWSSVGECKRNPWMQENCQKDCNVCNGGADVPGCLDYHPRCAEWAKGKECKKNPTWMEENCRKSCSICSRSMADLMVLCGVPKNSNVCEDHNDKCKTWAASQECERNPWWMKQNCPLSCKSCKTP